MPVTGGALWGTIEQWGLEAVYATAVAATRRMYLTNPSMTRVRAPRPHSYATGTRDPVRALTLGPIEAAGVATMDLSGNELVEPLLITVAGGVTPTTPTGATNARQWVFSPSSTLDSITREWDDGARVWQGTGYRGDQLALAGDVKTMTTASLNFFGANVAHINAITGSLPQRTPSIIEGWETELYIDAFGGTPGTTYIGGTLLNWSVQFQGNLGRKYFADNTLATGAVVPGLIGVTATLTFEANSAQALTEFNNWDAVSLRLVRLKFGGNKVIDAGTNEVQTVTITGSPVGGTFPLSFRGYTTTGIAFNATAGAVQAALAALPSIGVNPLTGSPNVTVGGGPGPGTPWTVAFTGRLGGQDLPQMTTSSASLTGGSSPAVAVTTSTPGVGYREQVLVDIPGGWTAMALDGNADGTRTYQLTYNYVFDPTNSYAIQYTLINSRTTAYSGS